MDVPDILRMIVMVLGGAVVGAGFPIMRMRATQYKEINISHGAYACWWLMIVNILALGFIASLLIDRWGQELSWRWWVAFAVFSAKGAMFYHLRAATLEEHRRRVFAR